MKNLTEAIAVDRIQVQKSLRTDEKRVLTSGPVGKTLPIAYVPMFREDRLSLGRMRVKAELAEMPEVLMNPVQFTVYAHFIPKLAFDRFDGMDRFNKSYAGQPDTEGGPVVPFIQTQPFDPSSEIYSTMGLHARTGDQVSTDIPESYNLLHNYRRRMRSRHLPYKALLSHELAPAFWRHGKKSAIVPDYDQALIDGEVHLDIQQTLLPIQGIGRRASGVPSDDHNIPVNQTEQTNPYDTVYAHAGMTAGANDTDNFVIETDSTGRPKIFAQLQAEGISMTLSQIEKAKETAMFAKLRKRYKDYTDDHIIDLLMDGVRVPEEALSRPILLDKKSTIFGYNRRFATDSGNLDKSVTSGETFVDLVMRLPEMNTGGIILITAEIVPELLWERQKDHFFHADSVDKFPSYVRDYLDPDKVAIVPNEHVDIDHDDPDGTFGYAPLNYQWHRDAPNIGGKFYRPEADMPEDEDRQRIWANETVNPTLTEDWYLANNLHTKIFSDQLADHVEIVATGQFDIVGNMVNGQRLEEGTEDFEEVLDDAGEDGPVDT